MIEPISIQLHAGHVVTSANTGGPNDDRMTPVPVELIVNNGETVGYIRYLTDDAYNIGSKHYRWQVCSRLFNTDEYKHISTFTSFEAALHQAMAVAYDYKARQLDQ